MSDDDLFGVMEGESDEFVNFGDADPFAKSENDDAKDDAVTAEAGRNIQEPVAEAPAPEPTPVVIQPEPTPPVAAATAPSLKKLARKPLTPRQKAIGVILRRAGVDEVPELDHLLRNKGGKAMRICDIGLFIDEPEDQVLAKIAKDCPCQNRVNLSAEVLLSQVKKVGSQILQAGRMYQPIQVARIEEDGAYECTSGRHRLAFLALIYGAKANIKVYVEDMTLQEGRDAVVVANMARPTKAMERAEHAVLQAVHGDVNAAQDDLYKGTATTKNKAKKYCVFSVLKNKYPAELTFKLSLTASRHGGALTTITNIENFWSAALDWHKAMEREEFDAALKKSVEFLNKLADQYGQTAGFDEVQHMSSMALSAVGKYYSDVESVTGDAISRVPEIATAIVQMGNIGRQKSDLTYSALAKALRS